MKKNKLPRPVRRRQPSPPAMEWKGAVQPGIARVTALGDRRLLIENYSSVRKFSSELIQLETADGYVAVEGEDLSLADLRPSQCMICGRIARVCLPCDHAKEERQ